MITCRTKPYTLCSAQGIFIKQETSIASYCSPISSSCLVEDKLDIHDSEVVSSGGEQEMHYPELLGGGGNMG